MEQPNDKPEIVRRSKDQLLELLKAFEKNPGMTVKAFCLHHKITEAAFYTARKRYRMAHASKKNVSGFIALTSPATTATGSLFAEVNGIRLYQAVPAEYLKALVL